MINTDNIPCEIWLTEIQLIFTFCQINDKTENMKRVDLKSRTTALVKFIFQYDAKKKSY